jgi:hypothetical protein
MTDEEKTREAARVLEHHCVGDGGLLDELRPFTGSINTASTQEVIDAIRSLVTLAQNGVPIRFSTLAQGFFLIHTVRRWALDKDSMLVRNALINDHDREELLTWIVEAQEEFGKLLGTLAERESGSRHEVDPEIRTSS